MKSLRFKKLWLVSEASRAARRIEFNSKMTLLVGKNHTGKSTVVKHIFRTLGCETKGKNDRWDSLAISVLEFDLDGQAYTAYRRANAYALRNETTQTITVTTSYREWADIIAQIFDFRLMLPTHQGKLALATPPYLFLPYYLDQDGSWHHQWNSFDKLSQFANLEETTGCIHNRPKTQRVPCSKVRGVEGQGNSCPTQPRVECRASSAFACEKVLASLCSTPTYHHI